MGRIKTTKIHKRSFCQGVWWVDWATQVTQWERICLKTLETWVQSLGQQDPLEEEMTTHFSILAWRIPWTEEPGRLRSIGLQRVGHVWAAEHAHNELVACWQNSEFLPSCHQHGPYPTSAPTKALSLKELLQFSLLDRPHLLQETHSNQFWMSK